MRLLAVLLVLGVAGCLAPGPEGAEGRDADSFSFTNTLRHSFRSGEPSESHLQLSARANVETEAVFTTSTAAGPVAVCPADSTATVEYVAPDGRVVSSFGPDARGVMGNGRCGERGESFTAQPGTWTIRYSGQGDHDVVITVRASSMD